MCRLPTILNNGNNSYNNYNQGSSNFTVAVSGLNANPSTFPGSLSGTQVTVAGSYSVTALQLQGYSATYSSGCTGTLQQGQSALCVVTESNTSSYYNQYPTPYLYNYYYNVPLSCTPSYQTVNLGQTATFTAKAATTASTIGKLLSARILIRARCSMLPLRRPAHRR